MYDDIYRLKMARYGYGNFEPGAQDNNNYENRLWERHDLTFDSQMTYELDDAGNREKMHYYPHLQGIVTTEYFPNDLNQYESIKTGSVPVGQEHDRCGNLIEDGEREMFYDYTNRLVQMEVDWLLPAIDKLCWRYDALGRRVQLIVSNGLPEKMNYFYDGQQIITKTDETGSVVQRLFIYGLGIDEPLAMVRPGEDYWSYYHFNHLGSVMCLTDSDGDIEERYEYDAYGKPTIRDASGNVLTESVVNNYYMFTGRRWDFRTKLYHYRARAYNPETGRFLQRDPVNSQINLYQYVFNNPCIAVDPFGEKGKLVIDETYGFGSYFSYWNVFGQDPAEQIVAKAEEKGFTTRSNDWADRDEIRQHLVNLGAGDIWIYYGHTKQAEDSDEIVGLFESDIISFDDPIYRRKLERWVKRDKSPEGKGSPEVVILAGCKSCDLKDIFLDNGAKVVFCFTEELCQECIAVVTLKFTLALLEGKNPFKALRIAEKEGCLIEAKNKTNAQPWVELGEGVKADYTVPFPSKNEDE